MEDKLRRLAAICWYISLSWLATNRRHGPALSFADGGLFRLPVSRGGAQDTALPCLLMMP